MNYLRILLPNMPLILFISGLIYSGFFFVRMNKRQKLSILQIGFEFSLVGWFVMFIFVTQLISFGNDFGKQLNLVPLKPIYIAIKYGAINSGMAIQFLLNIFMFIPFGFLLPFVFERKFSRFLPILAVSLLVSFLTELIQLNTGRNADIDDLIANTIGGLLGFALYIFLQGILFLVRKKISGQKIFLQNYSIKFFISIGLLIVLFSPIVLIKFLEMEKQIGYVYYGHPIPTSIEIPETISKEEGIATIFKIEQTTSLEELKARLVDLSGFDCTFEIIGHETYRCEESENLHVIFIYPDLIWSVFYQFGQQGEENVIPTIKEEEAIHFARQYLDIFQISTDSLMYTGMQNNNFDGYYHLAFEESTSNFENFIWGAIFLTIDSKGELVSISDNRMNFQFYQTVDTISPRKSIDIARDVGLGEWKGFARINEIRPSYFFNQETGFLIPTWQIEADFISESGQIYSWQPNIDATKHLTW